MRLIKNGIGEMMVKEEKWDKIQKKLMDRRAVIMVDPPRDGFVHVFYDIRPVHKNELGVYLYSLSRENPEGLKLY